MKFKADFFLGGSQISEIVHFRKRFANIGLTRTVLSHCIDYLCFKNEEKSIKRGENHYNSGHVSPFLYAAQTVRGKVQASMNDKEYVEVSVL